jgi:ADP-heptose:LPS heptosyltransferase
VHARWTRPRPARHALERYAAALAPLGIAPSGPPRVTVGPDAEAWAAERFTGVGPRVAMCPGARHETKRWPEEHWLALHQALAAEGAALVYVSTEPERAALPRLAARVAADPRASWWCESVARAGAALSRCPVAVTCDSGLMHLAARAAPASSHCSAARRPSSGSRRRARGTPCCAATSHVSPARCTVASAAPRATSAACACSSPALVAEHALERLRPSPSSAGA